MGETGLEEKVEVRDTVEERAERVVRGGEGEEAEEGEEEEGDLPVFTLKPQPTTVKEW